MLGEVGSRPFPTPARGISEGRTNCCPWSAPVVITPAKVRTGELIAPRNLDLPHLLYSSAAQKRLRTSYRREFHAHADHALVGYPRGDCL